MSANQIPIGGVPDLGRQVYVPERVIIESTLIPMEAGDPQYAAFDVPPYEMWVVSRVFERHNGTHVEMIEVRYESPEEKMLRDAEEPGDEGES